MIIAKARTEYMENVSIIHSCTAKKVNKFIDKKFKIKSHFSDDSMWQTLLLWNWARKAIVIYINNVAFKSVAETISTAYHEAWHAVFFMLERAWIDPMDSSWEHFLYLQDFFTQEILKSINKYQTWQKKRKQKKHKKKLKK